jgi:hypothetical protein
LSNSQRGAWEAIQRKRPDPLERAANAAEAGLGGILETEWRTGGAAVDGRRQLPDADDFPSMPAELAVHAFVAGHVVFSFLIPKLPVGFGAGVALGAAVPEASVDEDGELLLGEGKVGLSRQWKMPSPADDLVLFEQRQKHFLGLLISPPPDEGHHERTVFS